MASGELIVNVEIRPGPTLRRALKVLSLAGDILDLVPEWNSAERRLTRAATDMVIAIQRELPAGTTVKNKNWMRPARREMRRRRRR